MRLVHCTNKLIKELKVVVQDKEINHKESSRLAIGMLTFSSLIEEIV